MSNQLRNCSCCGISDSATQYVNGGSHEAQDSVSESVDMRDMQRSFTSI